MEKQKFYVKYTETHTHTHWASDKLFLCFPSWLFFSVFHLFCRCLYHCAHTSYSFLGLPQSLGVCVCVCCVSLYMTWNGGAITLHCAKPKAERKKNKNGKAKEKRIRWNLLSAICFHWIFFLSVRCCIWYCAIATAKDTLETRWCHNNLLWKISATQTYERLYRITFLNNYHFSLMIIFCEQNSRCGLLLFSPFLVYMHNNEKWLTLWLNKWWIL